MESNYDEYRPLYRPMPTESKVIAYGLRPKMEAKGICLCKVKINIEDFFRTIIRLC